MKFACSDHPRIPIDAPIRCITYIQWRDKRIMCIADLYSYSIGSSCTVPIEKTGNINREASITTFMYSCEISIYIYLRYLVGCFKIEENLLIFPGRIQF